jgi:HSP20 family protein
LAQLAELGQRPIATAQSCNDVKSTMSRLPAQHQPRSAWPGVFELFTGFPVWAGLHPLFDDQPIPLEDEMKDGRYEIRAEIPGIDPSKDIDITVRDGRLTIKTERSENAQSNGRTEFS